MHEFWATQVFPFPKKRASQGLTVACVFHKPEIKCQSSWFMWLQVTKQIHRCKQDAFLYKMLFSHVSLQSWAVFYSTKIHFDKISSGFYSLTFSESWYALTDQEIALVTTLALHPWNWMMKKKYHCRVNELSPCSSNWITN